MTKNGSVATIREVYQIATRLEDKIDTLDKKMSNMEGKATVLAVIWSSIISIVGITTSIFIRK